MKNKAMRACATVTLILAMLFIIDNSVGKVMEWMLPQISSLSGVGKTYFSLNDINTPVVIVGSSRAARHYDSQMIEDYIELPTYNAGLPGYRFSYSYCILNSILDRYNPELVIWDIGTEYLYEGIKDPLEALYPYYNRNVWITDVLNKLPWTEKVKLTSRCYRYNTEFFPILTLYIRRIRYVEKTNKGYAPLDPQVGYPLELKPEDLGSVMLGEAKVEQFRSTIERAKLKGVKVIVVDSPLYKIRDYKNLSAEKMSEICKKYGALFIDNSQLPFFLEHPELFYDAEHLDGNGAKIYTEMFLDQIEHSEHPYSDFNEE